jgi:hypothetical protein
MPFSKVKQMALLYAATLIPSKIEILNAWIPNQSWYLDADVSSLEIVGAYRFDDPDDHVGIETHLVLCDNGRILQVPLTYREAPLEGDESTLITTMQHSVLGKRWIYDGCGDPVYVAALARTILTGAKQAELFVATDDGPVKREATTMVRGTGSHEDPVSRLGPVSYASDGATTVISAGELELTLLRVIGLANSGDFDETLSGTWPGSDEPSLLAGVRTI